ncbi:MAG: hypothetical protein EA365_08800 [Gloeocapsa sp. DLM2.Bin57]|nr:MAG: hypothetical protein EA365_08800 [Gloeocapsa sp. DLM2.Bin57]
MTEETLEAIKAIIKNDLAPAIASILQENQKIVQWVDIKKAAISLDCSPKLLRSLIEKGALKAKLHYIDLTPDESRRTYRFNVKAITEKGLCSGLPQTRR